MTRITSATLLFLLSTLVIYGWFSGNTTLTQVYRGLAPMQFNTALCFFEFSLALVFMRMGNRHLVIPFGIMATVVSLLTLVQYITGLNFGLDEAFKMAYITVKTSHPGRMAPGTAAAFLAAGAGLLSYPITNRLLGPCGVFVLLTGLLCFLGYLFSLKVLYGFGPYTDMAIHTSLGFVFLGVGMLAIWKQRVT